MEKCEYCGKMFEPTNYQKRRKRSGQLIFCSQSCGTTYRYKDLQIVTPEIVDNIRSAVYGTNKTMYQIQKESGLSQTKFAQVIQMYKIKRDKDFVNNIRRQHTEQTISEKYGVDNVMHIDSVKQKQKESLQKTYDVNLEDITAKRKATRLKKYGNENYNNSEQTKQTNLDKYGVTTVLKTDNCIEKRDKAVLEKFGVDNALKSDYAKVRAKEVRKENLGYECAFSSPEVRKKIENTLIKKYGVSNIMKLNEYKTKSISTMLERYGVTNGFLTDMAINSHKHGTISKLNKSFSKQLQEVTMKNIKLEHACKCYLYDILLGDDIVIDLNPTISHNTYMSYPYIVGMKKENIPISKDYHYKRRQNAVDNNLRLISVFDWDDLEKIKYLIQDKQTLYARNLELKEVSMEETSEFLNNYHIQNTCRGQDIRLGLYKDNELIEIMTFGKPRYNRIYDYELLRLCTHKDYKVVGGAEKLFKHFIDNYKPKNIISYCDLSKFTGEVYTRLGFVLNRSGVPSKHWSRRSAHITDNLLRQRGYDQLFGTDYGKGTSNEELMLQNGWLPIYDCGQATYVYNQQ